MENINPKQFLLVFAVIVGVVMLAHNVIAQPPPPVTIQGDVVYAVNGTRVPNGWIVNITDTTAGVLIGNATTNDVNLTIPQYSVEVDPSLVIVGHVIESYSEDPTGTYMGTATHTVVTGDDTPSGTITMPDVQVSMKAFDTGTGTYPSIMGTHTGNFTPAFDLTVHRMYTYPCAGTGGHTEYVAFYHPDGPMIKDASWTGYQGNYCYIEFAEPFTLEKDIAYNYTIITGSYPQIIHNQSFTIPGGTITCTKFVDANGDTYNNWIPAIRL